MENWKCKREVFIEESTPYLLCILGIICDAGFNIVSKVALDNGMSYYVLVAYGQAFGTVATALLAFIFERSNESKINILIWRNIFFLGVLGALLGRTLYYVGLEYTSAVFASSLANTIPSITFILAVLCRLQKFHISNRITQAKIAGTVIAFGGATIMTLYKGVLVMSVHLTHYSHQTASSTLDKSWIKGSLLLVISYISFSMLFILQTITIKAYPAPMTLTSLSCLSGTLLSTILSAIMDHKASSWRLSWNITLLAPLYNGIVTFGVTVYLQTLVIRKKGPVFVTAFRPLCTLVVAIMALPILGEALHLGSIIGALLIIVGLYTTLWGKKKEKGKISLEQSIVDSGQDIQRSNLSS